MCFYLIVKLYAYLLYKLLKDLETGPPEGTRLKFTMAPRGGLNATVVFVQKKTSLLLEFSIAAEPDNEYWWMLNTEDTEVTEVPTCSSNNLHLYMIKDTSCCTDPTREKCTSVDGMKLKCLLKTGN